MEVSNSVHETSVCSSGSKSPGSRESISPTKPTLEPPPKKRARFSISSILGQDNKKCPEQNPDSGKDRVEDNQLTTTSPHPEIQPTSPEEAANSSSPVSSPTSPNRHLQDPAKYNAFLAQFSNPDVAKLYRWPLLWSPFMGVPQGSLPPSHPGLLRPPFLQPPPFLPQINKDKAPGQRSQEEEKGYLEAGEIIRPVAFRSSVQDSQSLFKRGILEPPHGHKDIHSSSSPGPFLEGRRDIDTDIKLSEERKTSYTEADLENDMVEIEVEETVDSDNEAGENGGSGEDSLRSGNCERKKKTRTVFSRSQIFQLETMFDMKRYLSSSERAGLAKALNMTETQVKIWFQNRRNKWKRQIAAEMEAANMSQVTGQRLMQLPYMYGHEELSRGIRSQLPVSPIHSGHPVVPPSVHHYYGGILRSHTS